MDRVEHGDCLEVIPRLVAEGVVVDSIVTDPPYHLTSVVKRFGKIDPAADTITSRRLRDRTDGLARQAVGFMNQTWDGGDIAFRPETWATFGTILKPGGYLLAFGGTRSHHRVWCAIEDAGFVIQDTLCWLYGSGFPKHKTQLKPAWEPICMAYKPSGKRKLQIDDCRTPTNEVLTGGAGKLWSHYRDGKEPKRALRIDDCRIPTDELQSGYHHRGPDNVFEGGLEGSFYYDGSKGRYPANVLHDGSDEVLAAFAVFSERNGGSVARFFYSGKATQEERGQSKHPTVKPLALLSWLVRLVTPREGTILDPFAGSGTMGHAAFKEGCYTILIEREQHYVDTIRQRLEWQQPAKSNRRPRPRGAKWMTKV